MPAAVKVDMLLPLWHQVPEAGAAHRRLRDGGNAQAGKTDVGHPVNIGQVIDQALEAQEIDDIKATQRAMARVVAEGHAIARLAYQVRTESVAKRISHRSGVAHSVELSDGRQVRLEGAVVVAVPGIAS